MVRRCLTEGCDGSLLNASFWELDSLKIAYPRACRAVMPAIAHAGRSCNQKHGQSMHFVEPELLGLGQGAWFDTDATSPMPGQRFEQDAKCSSRARVLQLMQLEGQPCE